MKTILLTCFFCLSLFVINAQQPGACCLPDGNCVITDTETLCLAAQGVYQGDGTDCSACGDVIPTLSQWGLIILGLVFLIFGFVTIRKRIYKVA